MNYYDDLNRFKVKTSTTAISFKNIALGKKQNKTLNYLQLEQFYKGSANESMNTNYRDHNDTASAIFEGINDSAFIHNAIVNAVSETVDGSIRSVNNNIYSALETLFPRSSHLSEANHKNTDRVSVITHGIPSQHRDDIAVSSSLGE